MAQTKEAVFLDRDGVVNEVVFRNGKHESPRTLAEFRFVPGILDPLLRLRAAGYRLFVVSNQPDIARGRLDLSTLNEMTRQIMEALPLERVLVCTHDDVDNCLCRKPKPGMLLEVAEGNGVDLSRSFMVGDSWKDIESAKNAGCRAILLRRSYNQGVVADYGVEDLSEAADFILKRGEQ